MSDLGKQDGRPSGQCCHDSGMDRRDFLKLTGGGIVALLASRMTVTGGPVKPGPAKPFGSVPADAYLKYLRATKGIADIRVIRKSGSGPNFLDVVIVSAGFTANQMGEFHDLCVRLADTLVAGQPWKRYQGLVNVHAVFVDDKGVDSSKLNVSGYQGEVLGCDDEAAVEYGRYAVNSAATVVLHNSSFSTASAGVWGVAALSKADVSDPGAVAHELGHGFAGLGDEYIQREGPFDETPESLQDTVNVTAESSPALCKWHYWTAGDWPGIFGALKLPQGVKVANFEGAGWPSKIYRPEETCLMRGDRADFCVVCNETMEANFFRYIDVFKSVEPAGEELVLWKGESVDFRMSTIDMLQHPPDWLTSRLSLYLDGAEVASSGRGTVAFRLRSKDAGPGVHQFGANLNVQSQTVRRDFGFLSDNRGWRVKVVSLARPEISVKPLVVVNREGLIDVSVRVKRASSPVFELKMTHAPEGAVLEKGRFKWDPAGAMGSWRIDFSVMYEGKSVANASMELQVGRKGCVAEVPEIQPLEPVVAVTGTEVKIQLMAGVKDGGNLLFEPVQVAEGVELDRYTGELSWVPGVEQAGPQSMRFRVKNGLAMREADLVFWVRWAATPSPVSYCNDYIPSTVEALKRLRESPAAYRRMFEVFRLLRDRYGGIHQEALAEAKVMWTELAPALRDNGYQELYRHAWSFADRPGHIKWLRDIAAEATPGQADRLISQLDQIDQYNAGRTKRECPPGKVL